MRKNIERLSTSRKALVVLATSAASLALSGCGDKESEWVFAVKCPEIQEVNVTEFSNSRVIVQCGAGDTALAPISVELISGQGLIVKDDETDSSSVVTVGYKYDSSFLTGTGFEPELGAITIREGSKDAVISMSSMTLTEVIVQSPQDSAMEQ